MPWAPGRRSGRQHARIAELTTVAEAEVNQVINPGAGWFSAGQTPEPIPGSLPTPSEGELRREAAFGALETINELLDRTLAKRPSGA